MSQHSDGSSSQQEESHNDQLKGWPPEVASNEASRDRTHEERSNRQSSHPKQVPIALRHRYSELHGVASHNARKDVQIEKPNRVDEACDEAKPDRTPYQRPRRSGP
jgi:hypothetical protein